MTMFTVVDADGEAFQFQGVENLKEYIEQRHAEEGGFTWISEITDDEGHEYGCQWDVKIVGI